MPKVSNPFGPGKVDTNDPSGSAMSILFGVLGIGLFTVLLTYGSAVGDWVSAQVDGLLGTNASGQGGFSIRGEL